MEDEDEKTSKEMVGIGIKVQTKFSQPAHALQFPNSWSHSQVSIPVRSTGIPMMDCSFKCIEEELWSEKEDRRKTKGIFWVKKEISRKRRRNEKGNQFEIPKSHFHPLFIVFEQTTIFFSS